MKRILLFCPTYDVNGIEQMQPLTRQSIAELTAPEDTQVDVWIGKDNPYEASSHKNTLHQYQQARKRALDEGYDALFTVEHDMVLPKDALVKLDEVDASVVYGLYMLRNHGKGAPGGTVLNAFGPMGKNPTIGESLSIHPDKLEKARKQVIAPVSGCGFGATLIRRDVLAKIEFHKTDPDSYAPDWGFALDCQKQRIKQICRFDVECGHIERGVILWPFTKTTAYKVIANATMWINDNGQSVRIFKDQEIQLSYNSAEEHARAGYVRMVM